MKEKLKKPEMKLKFSMRERRGILLLLPLLAVLIWIIWSAGRSRFDGSAEVVGDRIAQLGPARNASAPSAEQTLQYSPVGFDPNTVTYEELRSMGVANNVAASLIRARERGKVFQIPEDFATSYGITDSVYAVFKPYIKIGEEYRIKAYPNKTIGNRVSASLITKKPDSVIAPFNPNEYSAEDFTALGFSPAQSEVIIRYRQSRQGFGKAEELAQCYVVSDEMFTRIKDFIVIPSKEIAGDESVDVGKKSAAEPTRLVDINTADSLTLVSVRGIGPRTAQDIITYRERLGGFHSVTQLTDLKVVTERNYDLMFAEILADSCEIRKIDINFATPKEIGPHPYLSDKMLRKILKNRQLKGGWRTTEEMIEDNTLTAEEARRLSPYLHFGLR